MSFAHDKKNSLGQIANYFDYLLLIETDVKTVKKFAIWNSRPAEMFISAVLTLQARIDGKIQDGYGWGGEVSSQEI